VGADNSTGQDVPLAERVLSAILQTVTFYLFAGWVYVALFAVFRPDALSTPIWHQTPWLRRDTFGAAAFAGSLCCYVLLQFLKQRTTRASRPGSHSTTWSVDEPQDEESRRRAK
jgi:hypothetical protein